VITQLTFAATTKNGHSKDIMKKISTSIISAALLFASVCTPALAAGISAQQKGEIEELIRGYMLTHPEILREMAAKLEENDKRAQAELQTGVLKSKRAEIFQTAFDPVVGNPKGDVTIVEFMDYNCGWCKKSVGEVATLVKSDPNLRVVFKEFPIFGQHSEYAARAALAAKMQGKYWELHQALFAHEGQVTSEVVDQVAEAVGLKMDQLKTDMASKPVLEAISANYDLAKAFDLSGTPAFIIDDQVSPGYLALDALQASVEQVRKTGCKYC
jgi:protein-disulfide isomerase